MEQGTDLLADAAADRAKEKSDLLLMFLLKARRPDEYRENIKVQHEHSIVDRLGAALTRMQRIESAAIDVTPSVRCKDS